METLVVVVQPRNQFHTRSKAQSHAQFGPDSPSSAINCRNFQTGIGILPTPLKSYTSSPPDTRSPSSPKTPSSATSDNKPRCKTATPKSAPIAINGKACRKERTFSYDENVVVVVPGGGRSMSFSELWAGPTYSNSPPPSSVPIPKFSVRPKRTVSLDLPGSSSPEIEMLHPVAKSAPASPRREHFPFERDLFANADSATKTLRRILNLNLDDD